jgi:predicted RND superfamily exporter protein
MDFEVNYQRYIDIADHWIADRPKQVILVFLILSGVLATGLGQSGTESGTSQFVDDVPAADALDEVNNNFERITFEGDTGTTQLIQSSQNVLSKPELLRMLRAQHRLSKNPELQVESTTSVAQAVARTLAPSAETFEEQIRAVETATPSEIDQAVQTAVERNPQLQASLSNDFNARSASASVTIGIITHQLQTETDSGPGSSGSSPLTSIQQQAVFIVDSVGGDITVFGSGLTSEELSSVISDSLTLVVPAAVGLILFFLVIAYRDPVDLLLGLVALAMTILWTFGFMGLAGIAFSQLLIAVPPLLLAVGIDFGIHAINRYREERVQGYGIQESMRTTTDQLLVAFAIVTGTTVVGFAANMSSPLGSIRDFGIVAAIGIVFTFLIFGVFLPASKVYADQLCRRYPIPRFGSQPLGSEDSLLGRALLAGVYVSRTAPKAFIIVLVLSTAWIGVYGSGVESRFSQDDFLPPEENPEYLKYLPAGVQPSEYTVTETTNFLEDRFQTGEEDTTTVYVEGSLTDDGALESMYRAGDAPPDSFIVDNGHARETSIVTVIQSHADRNPEFAALVARNDRNDNGIPDKNLVTIYDALLDSPARGQALNYITDDYTSARIQYAVEADATQDEVTTDTRTVADRFRFEATATGGVIVLKAVSDVIGESALISLALALVGSGIFLIIAYAVLEGRPLLGVVNLLPIAVTVAGIAATMRYLGIPFNVLTGTILSIGLGLGTDYSAHLIHRFSEEYEQGTDVFVALTTTVRGTGGALTGSMLTTVTGLGVLVIAITPVLGQFGILTGLTILYSYLASVIIVPSALVIWSQFAEYDITEFLSQNKPEVNQ